MRYRSNNAFGVPDDDPRPVRRRRPRRAVPLAVGRGVLHPRPGLKVVVPSTPYDAKGLLRSSIRDEDPVLFFEHKKMYRSVRGEVPDGEYTVPLGRAAGHAPGLAGHRGRVRADGPLRARGGRPRGRGGDQRRGRRPADAPPARPRDAPRPVRKTGKCLVVYEDNKFGGYGAEVAAIVAEEAFDYLDGPVTRVAGPDVPGVPYNHVLEDWFMVNPEKIADGIRKLAAY